MCIWATLYCTWDCCTTYRRRQEVQSLDCSHCSLTKRKWTGCRYCTPSVVCAMWYWTKSTTVCERRRIALYRPRGMGLDLETSAHIVLVQGEIKRWRDVINFDEDQPAWPIILQIWKASGLKLDEALGYPISDDMEELFVKLEGGDDSDRVVVVKEEKEEEGKLRLPEPEESTEELREVTSGMSVERRVAKDLSKQGWDVRARSTNAIGSHKKGDSKDRLHWQVGLVQNGTRGGLADSGSVEDLEWTTFN
eukprot:g82319.t1